MRIRVLTTSGALELLANGVLIAVIPLLSRVLHPFVGAPTASLGFGTLLDDLSGRAGFTDIGQAVASVHGLVDSAHSAYDSLLDLNPLLGMGAYDFGTHTHPPTSMALWLPLVPFEYHWWLSFFVVASFSAIALSMRVMRVSGWAAYPLALMISLTPVGTFALSTTYPLSALFLALAWTYRTHVVIAGCAYAFLTASRGVAVLLLLYPMVKRQWRTLLLAVGIVLGLLVVGLSFEPSVIQGFLTKGRESIDIYVSQANNFTLHALAARHSVPVGVIWIASTVVVALALLRRHELFWALAWFTFAVTPIAWIHSSVAALPMLVVMWQSGRLGRVLTLIVGGALVAIFPAATTFQNLGWTFLVLITGLAVVACPLGAEPSESNARPSAGKAESDTTGSTRASAAGA